MHGGEMCIGFQKGYLMEEGHLEDLGMDGKILKWFINIFPKF
jgi:hypothetical protein